MSGSGANKKPRVMRILFICTGNTCRSAMAESVFRHEIKARGLSEQFAVSSAGLYVRPGDKMNDNAVVALKNKKITVHRHRARVLTKTLIARATLIVCMTAEHKATVKSKKALTVGEITGRGDVPDPYGYGVEIYERVLDYLRSTVDAVFEKTKEFAQK